MRRVLFIAAALVMMLRVHALRVAEEGARVDPLTLAAIGFVVLAAFVVGEMGASLKLPKVTGYIVAGVLLGPQVFDILSTRVVGEMQVFNTLALGLIATTAGLELDFKAIRKVWKTLAVTVALKVPVLLILVGGTFWAIQTYVPVLPIEGSAAVLALSLLFGVLAIGTSPAIALAVVSESGSKGRLSDIVMAIAVVKDLVVVVCLALAIGVARSLIDPEGHLDAHVLARVGEEVGLSLAVGAGFGVVTVLYLRFLRKEMLLFAVAMVLLAAEVSHWLHLELLLVLIATGFVVRNFSKHEHELLTALTRVALPVFVVFFTTAGASVDLHGTLTVLPLALALAAARAVSFFVAAAAGGRAGGEGPGVRKNAWMAYVPQAGVTLGLVLLASEALPEVAEPLRKTGMALVALHLLVGPVLLSVALRRAGEVPGAGPQAELPPEPVGDGPPAAGAAEPGPAVAAAAEPSARVERRLEGPLALQVVALGRDLDGVVDRFLTTHASAAAALLRRTGLALLAGSEGGRTAAESVEEVLRSAPPSPPPAWERQILDLYASLAGVVQSLPEEATVPMAPDLLEPLPGEPFGARSRRSLVRLARALRRRSGLERRVPLRQVARVALEGRLADTAAVAHASWFRSMGRVLAALTPAVRGAIPAEGARAALDVAASGFEEQLGRDLRHAIRAGLEAASRDLALVGSPRLSKAAVRYSAVEPEVRRALDGVASEGGEWRGRLAAAFDTLRAEAASESAARRIDRVVEARVLDPLEAAHEAILPVLASVEGRLQAAGARPTSGEEALEALLAEVRASFDEADRMRLRRARTELRRSTRRNEILGEVSQIIGGQPARLTVLDPAKRLEDAASPKELELVGVDFAREVELRLGDRLVPALTQALSPITAAVADCDARLKEAVHAAAFGVELALRGQLDEGKGRKEAVHDGLARAAGRCRALLEEIEAGLGGAAARAAEERDAATAEIRSLATERLGTSERVRATVASRWRALASRSAAMGRDAARRGLAALRWVRGRLSRDRRLTDWLIWARSHRLDAAEMGRYLREHARRPSELDLPGVYRQLFAPEPVEDRRLLSAYRAEADEVVRVLGARGKGRRASVLVLGETGSGRTSFVNEVEYRLSSRRVLRLDDAYHQRREGIFGALSTELGCPPDEAAVVRALQGAGRLVIIDDLEHYVTPTSVGLEEAERFLRTVAETTPGTQWLATALPETETLLRALPLAPSEVFEQRVQLGRLSRKALAAAVGARQRLAGIPVRYEMGSAVARLSRWRKGAAEALYFRRLHAASQGNLRAAFLAHVRSVRSVDGGLTASPPERSVLPFVAQLDCEPLALLGLLVRFGPMAESDVAAGLGTSEVDARGHVFMLERAGLVERPGPSEGKLLRVPAHLEEAVVEGLRELHVLGGDS